MNKFYADNINKIKPVTEWLYIAAMALYLLYRALKNTTFDLSFIGKTDRFFIVMFSIVLGAQIITHLDNIKGIIIAAIVLAASVAAYKHNTYIDVLHAGLLIAGAIDVKTDRILKVWTAVVGAVIIAAAFMAFSGVIANYTYISFRDYGYRVRGSLGTVFATDSATWILFAIGYIWAVWRKITDEAMILIVMAAMALFYFYHNGQTAVLCAGIMLIFIIFDMFMEKKSNTSEQIIDKANNNNLNTDSNNKSKRNFFKGIREKGSQKRDIWNTIVFWLITVAIPMGTAMLVGFAYLYGKGSALARKVDGIIDLRISESYTGISSYGIKLLGTYFKMYGFGGGSVDNAYKYFYLDSSYINILVRYGIIIFVIYAALWILSARKALKAGDRRLLLLMLLITAQSIEEHHFADVRYNPLFILALTRFTPVSLPERIENEDNSKSVRKYNNTNGKRAAAQMAAILVTTLILIVFVPHLLAGVRTEYQKIGYKEKKISVQTIVQADERAVETILEAAKAPVYTDMLPTVYYKKFGGFKKDIYFGEDHARTEVCTVLMDCQKEASLYFSRGFLYCQISDYTGVYTNDKSVSDALSAAGYHVTGFYSSKRNAVVTDKKKIAKIRLQAGKYTTYWKLHLKKEPDDEQHTENSLNEVAENTATEIPIACTIKVETEMVKTPEEIGAQLDAGEEGVLSTIEELASVQVLRSDFDEEGNAEITMEFTRGVENSVKLSLKNEEGYKVQIEECKYAQTPDVDVRNTINFYGQVIRSEYYDFNGNPAIVFPGCSIIEYEYNENKQISRIKFYDADGNKVMTEYGCWMIEYEYDEAGAVLAEKLFDMDGNPVPAQ
ncbi:MAG: hypothetical protein E7302_13535 [Butyrivibrio sp.]|nr:hypothetical protein [Butyrivibrio sp.]